MELRGASPVTPALPADDCQPGARVRLRAGDVQLYRVCEELTQWLLFAAVVFSPWAFGTTQPWSIWTMNIAGYALGALLLVKLFVRWWKGYQPPRWGGVQLPQSTLSSGLPDRTDQPANGLTTALAITTLVLLVYMLVSALNARATARFLDATLTFEYHSCIPWLPHSLDSVSTWNCFWTCLGLAGVFWAAHDWLLGKSDDEARAIRRSRAAAGERPPFPQRLRRLLWLLAINGALLGCEAIIQRLDHSPKLLFLVQPRIHKTAEGQFGPYAYRSNAAQYFNLLWPVCLGFWWTLNQRGDYRNRHALLPAAGVVMAACPIISSSRAGALLAVVMGVLAALYLGITPYLAPRRRPARLKSRTEAQPAHSPTVSPLPLFFTGSLTLGLVLGWHSLVPRLTQLNDGIESRQPLYEAAAPMARDYPWFGTGPGTFETVSYLYPRPDIFWPPQLHNDWLETRITFGRVGSALIALALGLVLVRSFSGGRFAAGHWLTVLNWLALTGCLAHARFDFPFQVHSILFLFLLLCAILFSSVPLRTPLSAPGPPHLPGEAGPYSEKARQVISRRA